MIHFKEDFEYLSLVAQGHSAFQLLFAGVKLGLFDELENHHGLDSKQMSERLELETKPTQILLRGLTALGFIKKNEEVYQNSDMIRKYMLSDSPYPLAATLAWQHEIVYPGVHDFIDALKKNSNVGIEKFLGHEVELYARLEHEPHKKEAFHHAMSALSKANHKDLSERIDFSGIQHLVDLGGGDGTNAIAIAKHHPQLALTVFDLSISMAERNIQNEELGPQVGTQKGDLFEDPFPKGMDGALLSHMLTIWSPEKNIELLRKIYQALPLNGKVYVFNMMSEDDETGPVSSAVGSVYFMSVATGQGMLYRWKDQKMFLHQAGFRLIEEKNLPRAHGLLVGEKCSV